VAGFLYKFRGARAAPEVVLRRPIRSTILLFRSPVYLLGIAIGMSSWLVHVGAVSARSTRLVHVRVARRGPSAGLSGAHEMGASRGYAVWMHRRCAFVGAVAVAVSACGLAGGASGAAGGSAIRGRIVAAPTCPVESVPPKPQCGPRALVASVRIVQAGGRSGAQTVRSDKRGGFVVRLAPGRYFVQGLLSAGSVYPRPPARVMVRVMSGRFTRITLTYDTGIR
jgi:hypothetical protein